MELLISNILFVGYIVLSLWQIYRHKDTMGDNSMHHFLSHLYIVIAVFISVNIFVLNGMVVPLILSGIYILQHVTKENFRLIKTNRFTPDLKEDI